ncbi:hypothetical protein D3C76_1320770 [compost metagenome]
MLALLAQTRHRGPLAHYLPAFGTGDGRGHADVGDQPQQLEHVLAVFVGGFVQSLGEADQMLFAWGINATHGVDEVAPAVVVSSVAG